MIPIYEDEMNYKLDKGLSALLEQFDQADVNELINPTRPSAL